MIPALPGDLRYRGFITYRGLRFIALICLTLSQVCAILNIYGKVADFLRIEELQFAPEWFSGICSVLGYCTFPLLLVASFSTIFSKPEGIFRTMFTNIGLAVITYFACAFFLQNVIASIIENLAQAVFDSIDLSSAIDIITSHPQLLETFGLDPSLLELINIDQIKEMLASVKGANIIDLLNNYVPNFTSVAAKYLIQHYANINVFLDLSLCSLFYFFLAYKPKKLSGGRLLLFKSCSILPVIYIIGSIFLDGLVKKGIISIPVWGSSLLANYKLPSYILFFLVVLSLKYNEAEHIAQGGTHKTFFISLKSRFSSLSFSVYLCVCIGVLSLTDYALSMVPEFAAWGMGSSYKMFAAIPFIMLFSFNKMPKHKWPDVFIPVYYILHYSFVSLLGLSIPFAFQQMLELAASAAH